LRRQTVGRSERTPYRLGVKNIGLTKDQLGEMQESGAGLRDRVYTTEWMGSGPGLQSLIVWVGLQIDFDENFGGLAWPGTPKLFGCDWLGCAKFCSVGAGGSSGENEELVFCLCLSLMTLVKWSWVIWYDLRRRHSDDCTTRSARLLRRTKLRTVAGPHNLDLKPHKLPVPSNGILCGYQTQTLFKERAWGRLNSQTVN
jgi:hypothetical protein